MTHLAPSECRTWGVGVKRDHHMLLFTLSLLYAQHRIYPSTLLYHILHAWNVNRSTWCKRWRSSLFSSSLWSVSSTTSTLAVAASWLLCCSSSYNVKHNSSSDCMLDSQQWMLISLSSVLPRWFLSNILFRNESSGTHDNITHKYPLILLLLHFPPFLSLPSFLLTALKNVELFFL